MERILIIILLFLYTSCQKQSAKVNIDYVDQYNVVWNSQSKNSSESMPLGGGDIGCNVWVENGDVLFYMSRSGTFDENNTMLKLGRTRIQLDPNPFTGEEVVFKQELNLREGCVYITGKNNELEATLKLWVEVFRPEIHVDIESSVPVTVKSTYETWRTEDHHLEANERMQCMSFNASTPEQVTAITHRDSIRHSDNEVIWYHRNRDDDLVFDKEVNQQHLDSIKDQLWNPQKNLTFGGSMQGENMSFSKTVSGRYLNTDFTGWTLESDTPQTKQAITVQFHTANAETVEDWENELEALVKESKSKSKKWQKNLDWWQQFWDRSHIVINANVKNKEENNGWQVGRNYQLFRYMLGCNAYGKYPTKFNGGLFTYDPHLVLDYYPNATPDFRQWGGGSFTAQNQRLVYWPMLKSGDFEMMQTQFDFYKDILKNVELKTEHYWGHKGAAFPEHPQTFGLPYAGIYQYEWGKEGLGPRKEKYSERYLKKQNGDSLKIEDVGYLNNPWVSDQYDTVLEFCLMILDAEQFTGQDISQYMPLIESSLTFFDEHYRYWNKRLNGKELDENGHLVIYPGTACETYKVAKNPVQTLAGLKTVTERLLELPDSYLSKEKKAHYEKFLKQIPSISFREMNGHKTIAPAESWEYFSNQEIPQLYPVFPYPIYGIAKPDLQVAVDTWIYGMDDPIQKNYVSWHQDNIFCARLGLVEEAKELTIKKMQDSERRFPTFWGPGHDWVPDHNWGGSGMIGLQEMLLQTDGKEIQVLPAWPKEWDVNFKLHAPYNTVVNGRFNGETEYIDVFPSQRKENIIAIRNKSE
ncbi:DUF5703 domain-containing protein [Aureibaculum sp. 2210JD6-5]|uniref:DUF5703 domain-containing protein n=1 Tax=Aureibaculum sp. 2210JD6-5 TaxID=3103957 RepID=UPI002AAD72CF|nr:DUF5703 domain-containing protein [Aureibaculum sp. 2210JD6-5]MDY7396316.1 DUF5703 domain-containing protein [Aureibaculum sp. 2210JD6-5]